MGFPPVPARGLSDDGSLFCVQKKDRIAPALEFYLCLIEVLHVVKARDVLRVEVDRFLRR